MPCKKISTLMMKFLQLPSLPSALMDPIIVVNSSNHMYLTSCASTPPPAVTGLHTEEAKQKKYVKISHLYHGIKSTHSANQKMIIFFYQSSTKLTKKVGTDMQYNGTQYNLQLTAFRKKKTFK